MDSIGTHIQLSQLNRLIMMHLEPFVVQSFWVAAEIAEIKSSARGHIYLELVEKSASQITAKSQAVIWYNQVLHIKRRFGKDSANLLKKGNKVLFKAHLDFHSVYGLKINIVDLDASVTLGELELRRVATIQQLEREGLLNKNKQLTMPLVLQKMAIISSATAAGLGDFISQLSQNPYAYKVDYQLFESAMQGVQVATTLPQQLRRIAAQAERFDAVVIIRGGGSKLDLDCFNQYEIGKMIADFPLPILTGIGHQQDETVADLVAHTALKTPTAVAEFILDSFENFESSLLQVHHSVKNTVTNKINLSKMQLDHLAADLRLNIQRRLGQEKNQVELFNKKLPTLLKYQLQKQNLQLQHFEQVFKLWNIEALLKKGFSIIRDQNGRVVQDIEKIKVDEIVDIQLFKGEIKAKVIA